MAIYTRTGDKGTTGLLSGKRVSKADLRVEIIGTIDELNSAIGVAIAEIQSSRLRRGFVGQAKLKNELIKIQNDLLDISSALANSTTNYQLQPTTYLIKRVKAFEELMDEMTNQLPPLKNFILPGGGKAGAMLHLARAICRRLERRVVALGDKRQAISNKQKTSLIIYFNRLSDLLFTMARFANFKEKKQERIWVKK